MTGQYVLSPLAKLDIENIWNHTAQHWGIDQAEIYTRQLRNHIETVAKQPALASACPEVRAGYYKYPSGAHLLFFRIIDGDIDVVRILHQRMDFMQHFDS